MKKIFAVIAALALSVLLYSCNTDDPADNITKVLTEKTKSSQESTTLDTAQARASNWEYSYALETPKIADTSGERNLLLVNREYVLPENYIDSVELVYVCSSGERLDSKAAAHYEEMFNAAARDGLYLTPCSGYRSYELQKNNFENRINSNISQGMSKQDATVEASSVILPPGTSEHNAGLAMDIICVLDSFENTSEFAWLCENAQDYGFILRYPKDKQDITKIVYEPWHWRYVGVEAAMEMKKSGQCLEEYLGKA